MDKVKVPLLELLIAAKNAVNRGDYVLPATPKGRARSSLGPKMTNRGSL